MSRSERDHDSADPTSDRPRRRPRRVLRLTRHTADAVRDVKDEVAFHIDMRTRELIEQGVDPAAAERMAREAFGDRAAIENQTTAISDSAGRRRRRAEMLDSLRRDVGFALRGLIRQPGFALAAIATLALCIGANVAVFSVIDTVVLRPLPFPRSDRIITFYNAYPGSGVERSGNSVPDYFDRRENLTAIDSVALYDEISATIGEGAAAANVFVSRVSPEFFDVLGAEPALGRAFDAEDGVIGRNTNVVISHGLWQSHFGGAEDVLGDTLEVDDNAYTVIGVMPADFEFVTWNAQAWFSLAWPESMRNAYHRNNFGMLGRLKPDATVHQAQQQLDALNAEILTSLSPDARRSLEAAGFRSIVRGWQDDLLRDFRGPLYLLWASVALVMLVGAFNVANLLLLRLSTRLGELSTRFVLGAGRWRLARQLFTESALLTGIGAALGLAFAAGSLRFLDVFEHYQVPRLNEVHLDGAAIAFALLAALGLAAMAALMPIVVVQRSDLFEVFRGGGATGRRTPGGRLLSARGALVAGQVAAAFVLVTTGGLLLSSLINLWAVDPGFETDDLAAGAVLLAADRYPEIDDRIDFRNRALSELRTIPGVSGAAFATQLPFSGEEQTLVFFPEGYERGDDEAVEAHDYTYVSPSFFDTLGIPLRAGRLFDARDETGAPPAVIIDEHLARRYWPDQSPIGRRVALNTNPSAEEEWLTVIGVVGSVVQNDLDRTSPRGAFYLPATYSGEVMWRWIVRADGGVRDAHEQAREAFRRLDPEMPVFWTTTMNGAIAERLIPRRIPMLLVIGFAALALFLTTLGVYGVVAYAATRRTREFGIRIALGSPVSRIYRAMLARAGTLIGIGIAAGATASMFVSRLIAGQLYGIRPTDARVLGGAAVAIAAVALLACVAPTRRATRVDPVIALREE